MDTRIITKNIKKLRKAVGLTQERLAQDAGLSPQTIKNLEGKASDPQVSTLRAIAKALKVKLGDLFQEPKSLQNVRFRSQKKLRSREDILDKVAIILENYLSLETILQKRSDFTLEGLRNRFPEDSIENFAQKCRAELGLDDQKPVIDVPGLLASAGVKVFGIPIASEGFFGLSVGKEDGGPAVVVNTLEKIPIERQIFSVVHELGHLLLHQSAFDVNKTELDDDCSETEEKEADCFASYFLMPQPGFAQIWRECQSKSMDQVDIVMNVKQHFKVSCKAVLYRLVELKEANRSIWPGFQFAFKKKYGFEYPAKDELNPSSVVCDVNEPFKAYPFEFLPNQLKNITKEALRKEAISISRAAEILGISVSDVREMETESGFPDGMEEMCDECSLVNDHGCECSH